MNRGVRFARANQVTFFYADGSQMLVVPLATVHTVPVGHWSGAVQMMAQASTIIVAELANAHTG